MTETGFEALREGCFVSGEAREFKV